MMIDWLCWIRVLLKVRIPTCYDKPGTSQLVQSAQVITHKHTHTIFLHEVCEHTLNMWLFQLKESVSVFQSDSQVSIVLPTIHEVDLFRWDLQVTVFFYSTIHTLVSHSVTACCLRWNCSSFLPADTWWTKPPSPPKYDLSKTVFMGQNRDWSFLECLHCNIQFGFLKHDCSLTQLVPLFTELTHRVSATSMNSHGDCEKVSFAVFVAASSPCCVNVNILYSGQKKNNNHLLLTFRFLWLFCPFITGRKRIKLDATRTIWKQKTPHALFNNTNRCSSTFRQLCVSSHFNTLWKSTREDESCSRKRTISVLITTVMSA